MGMVHWSDFNAILDHTDHMVGTMEGLGRLHALSDVAAGIKTSTHSPSSKGCRTGTNIKLLLLLHLCLLDGISCQTLSQRHSPHELCDVITSLNLNG